MYMCFRLCTKYYLITHSAYTYRCQCHYKKIKKKTQTTYSFIKTATTSRACVKTIRIVRFTLNAIYISLRKCVFFFHSNKSHSRMNWNKDLWMYPVTMANSKKWEAKNRQQQKKNDVQRKYRLPSYISLCESLQSKCEDPNNAMESSCTKMHRASRMEFNTQHSTVPTAWHRVAEKV